MKTYKILLFEIDKNLSQKAKRDDAYYTSKRWRNRPITELSNLKKQ